MSLVGGVACVARLRHREGGRSVSRAQPVSREPNDLEQANSEMKRATDKETTTWERRFVARRGGAKSLTWRSYPARRIQFRSNVWLYAAKIRIYVFQTIVRSRETTLCMRHGFSSQNLFSGHTIRDEINQPPSCASSTCAPACLSAHMLRGLRRPLPRRWNHSASRHTTATSVATCTAKSSGFVQKPHTIPFQPCERIRAHTHTHA